VKDTENYRGTTVHTIEQVGETVVYYILGGRPGNTCHPGHVIKSMEPFDSETTDKDEHEKKVEGLTKRVPPQEPETGKLDSKQTDSPSSDQEPNHD